MIAVNIAPHIEDFWSNLLGQTVEILPRGPVDKPDDYMLMIDGTYIVAYKDISEIEDYLATYFPVAESE